MPNTCLFIGRFQPFHNGHLIVLKGMVKLCKRIVIGIGSPHESGTAESPFSSAERHDMIQRALQGVDLIPLHDISLVDMPDGEDDAAWAKRCLELAGGDVAKVWTGNAWTQKSFEAINVPVQAIKEVPGISATEVRRRMTAGEDWKKLVPPEVAEFIASVEGVERMQKFG
ncbi:adenylyltransferase/cytidyltransferase family protein [Candidatus Uhrbacteria bacterium]|nr:adenylyltransferase/cytidyltransferase family protein [Candidatus Uhrbacteria bacterium]